MKTVEEIIVEKEYAELTNDELALVAELAENEQEYKTMRSLFIQMDAEILEETSEIASPEIKSSLDSIFMAKHPVIASDWKKEEEKEDEPKIVPLYNRNWFRVAAILLLCSGVSYMYINTDKSVLSQQNEQKEVAVVIPIEMPENNEDEVVGNDKNAATKTQTTAVNSNQFKTVVAPPAAFAEISSTKALEKDGVYAAGNVNDETDRTFFDTQAGKLADLMVNEDQITVGSHVEISAGEMLDLIQTVY